MPPEITRVLVLLGVSAVLFVTGWVRMDLVALGVMVALPLLGLLEPVEAFSGFSNPAVVTVWAMFIISAGLERTGVADRLGRQLVRFAGHGEVRLIAAIMLTAGVLSAFMNNIGVAAMMLPVVLEVARRSGHAPSRLLLPLALGSLLGGLTTLIGTPPNILVAEALREGRLQPFGLFDYTPVGGVILAAGVAFVALVGRRLLPARDPVRETAARAPDLEDAYEIGEGLFFLRVPPSSPLAGRTLAELRLGSVLEVGVLAIVRRGAKNRLAPEPYVVLAEGDRLLVHGRQEAMVEALEQARRLPDGRDVRLGELRVEKLGLAEARIRRGGPLAGRTPAEAELRARFGVAVLARRRSGKAVRLGPYDRLEVGDRVLLQDGRTVPVGLDALPGLEKVRPLSTRSLRREWGIGSFVALGVPADSPLAGKTLARSRLGAAFGLDVVALERGGRRSVPSGRDVELRPGDTLYVLATSAEVARLRALGELEVESAPPLDLADLESEAVGLAEVVLAPRSRLVGKTPRELQFREKYGLRIVAIWRQGEPYRSGLRDLALRLGDALLLYGPRDRLRLLEREPDFLVVAGGTAVVQRPRKAPLAVLVLAAALTPVLLGWIPIALAAVIGAVLMVGTRCLAMDEAYRAIEWRSVFLIAGMLPLGVALDRSGAAGLIASEVLAGVAELGPRAVLAALFLITSLATQVIPTAALVVLMSPIALSAAADLGISPYALMMTLAMAASASFASPISHPANVLVMGPGGYRFRDYMRVGIPLTAVVFILVVWLVPILWPFGV